MRLKELYITLESQKKRSKNDGHNVHYFSISDCHAYAHSGLAQAYMYLAEAPISFLVVVCSETSRS